MASKPSQGKGSEEEQVSAQQPLEGEGEEGPEQLVKFVSCSSGLAG